MRCVQVRNDEEEWERIRTNHEGLLWETRTSFNKENYDLKRKKRQQKITLKQKNTNKYALHLTHQDKRGVGQIVRDFFGKRPLLFTRKNIIQRNQKTPHPPLHPVDKILYFLEAPLMSMKNLH